MAKKTDLRIVKTKKHIYEALVEIMEHKSFEEIKVSEICEAALINRSTFYAHFEDKYELFNSLMNDLKSKLKNEIESKIEYQNVEEFYKVTIDIILNHLDENKNIYLKMMINNRNSVAMDMIYDTLKESIQARMESYYEGDIPVDIVTNFYIGGINNVVMLWLVNPHYTKSDLNDYLKKLIFNK